MGALGTVADRGSSLISAESHCVEGTGRRRRCAMGDAEAGFFARGSTKAGEDRVGEA